MSQENGNYDDGDGDRDSDCDSDTSEYREMAKQDACFDGSWIYDGHCGMMIGLDSPDFMEIQYEDFVDEKEQDPSLDVEEEFVSLEFVDRESEEDLSRLFQSLRERNLFVTNGVLRRFVEDMAPTRIRICRLHEELELKPMMELKQRGNEMFGKKKYQDAIDLYDEAVVFVADDMYIGPCDHIELIVNVLSNKAECELRLGMYYEAGNTATDALVFMEHEKARIRRAKAGLAIAKKRDEDKLESSVADLLQAKKDLEEVLDPKNDCTLAAKEACQKLMPNIENELNRWKIALLEKRPKLDWDLYVRMIRCNFWEGIVIAEMFGLKRCSLFVKGNEWLDFFRSLDNRPHLVLHVGPQKTGSTTLQKVWGAPKELRNIMEEDNFDYYFINPHRGMYNCDLDGDRWTNCKVSETLLIEIPRNQQVEHNAAAKMRRTRRLLDSKKAMFPEALSPSVSEDLEFQYTDYYYGKGNLCDIDIEAVMSDEKWIDFFASL